MKRIARVMALAVVVGCGSMALGQTAYTEGQKVEVREGDTWSGATILKREGRRYLIRYEGEGEGNDEWVTTDRIRAGGAAGGGAAAGAGAAAGGATGTTPTTPTPKPQPTPQWASRTKVEVKWGGLWRDATIINRRDEWYLVEYEPGRFREWVEPWRIRKVGSTEDKIGHAQPNSTLRNNEGPPNRKPGDPPKPFGFRADREADEEEGVAAKDDPAWKEVDTTGAELLQLESPGRNWKLALDVPDPAATKLALRAISLKGVSDEPFDAVKVLAIPRGNNAWAYACHVGGMPGRTSVRLERLDLAKGVSTGVFTMGANTLMLGVSPDGKAMLFRTDGFGFGKSDKVEIWTLDGAEPKKAAIFKPFRGEGHEADIGGGLFVAEDRILVWNRSGSLMMWDIKAFRPVYSCQMNVGCVPALSATGKYLAMNSGRRALVLETLSGNVVAEMTMETPSGGAFAFSPSGKQLAAWADRSVRVWDLTSGWPVSEFSTPLSIGGSRLRIVADGYGLVDGSYLLDFERRVVLWHYSSAPQNADAVAAGGQYLYVARGTRGPAVVAMAKLPHAAALNAAERVDPEAELLLRPGVKVSLQVDLGEDRDAVVTALTDRIKDAGLVLADNQPIVFRVFVEQGKSEERQYRTMGGGPFGGGMEKVTVTPQICRLRLEVDGKTAWETQTVSQAGHFMNLKQGQSIHDAVAEASKPQTGFLKTARLPRYLPRPKDPVWFGSSNLTAQGVGQ